MKRIIIYYFTGTNNTKIVTDLLGGKLRKAGADVVIKEMKNNITIDELKEIKAFDMLGIAYPLYGGGAPKMVRDFVEKLPKGKNIKSFILAVSGDYGSSNCGFSAKTTTQLSKKGYDVFYDKLIVMGSNFFINYGDEFLMNLYESAKQRTKHMADELLSEKKHLSNSSIFIKGLASIGNAMSLGIGAWSFGLSLHANSKCIKCMKCVDNCPNENIRLKNDKIKIGTDCQFCMKCVYICPTKAIKSRGMNFCILQDGYDPQKAIDDKSIKPIEIGINTGKRYKHFKEYLDNINI